MYAMLGIASRSSGDCVGGQIYYADPDADQRSIEWIAGEYYTIVGVLARARDTTRKYVPISEQLRLQVSPNPAADTKSHWRPCKLGVCNGTAIAIASEDYAPAEPAVREDTPLLQILRALGYDPVLHRWVRDPR